MIEREKRREKDFSDSNREAEKLSEKKHSKERRSAGILIVILALFLILIGISASLFSKFFTKKVEEAVPETSIVNLEDFIKGRVEGDIKSAMNKKTKKEIKEQFENKRTTETTKNFQDENLQKKSAKRGKNAQKDAEILQKYNEIMDAASSENGSGFSSNARRRFVPGGANRQGGVFIKNKQKSSTNDPEIFDLHNMKIKVKLEFSIRSTAPSTVVATVTEGDGKIPKNAKFYGAAVGFVNKRTQLNFSKLIIGSNEYAVKGFAISGKDPGIESEVTDISKTNIASSVKQGVIQTTSNAALKAAGIVGSIASDAAKNTLTPTTTEMQKQEEANKMTQEYRVPAGTTFYIYLE